MPETRETPTAAHPPKIDKCDFLDKHSYQVILFSISLKVENLISAIPAISF